MKTSVYILILNYNKPTDTLSCIKSLHASDLPPHTHLLIIDNSNHQDSFTPLLSSRLHYLKNNKNLGFAAGNNVGIRFAQKHHATHVLIINPDVRVPRHFMKPLLSVLNQFKDAGLVAPVHQHTQKDQSFYGLGGSLNPLTSHAKHQNVKQLTITSPQVFDFVSFACVLLPLSTIKRVGLLDERYFMYLEDVDYALTAKTHGLRAYIHPQVKIKHRTSSSFKKPTDKLKISFLSQLKFIHKWLPFPRNLVAYIYNLLFYPYLYLLWTYHYHKYKKTR